MDEVIYIVKSYTNSFEAVNNFLVNMSKKPADHITMVSLGLTNLLVLTSFT